MLEENKKIEQSYLKDENLDWWGEPILIWWKKMDNIYAQMVQDLLEQRM